MESALSLIGLAIVVFASTNIDDAFVLVGFSADKDFRVRDVVIGQYAGVSALCAVSAIAALISLVIPPAYIGLLGLIPIAIGVKKLSKLWRGKENKEEDLQRVSSTGTLGKVSGSGCDGGERRRLHRSLYRSF